jgi:acetyltransferase-like isoleucine patch superfamily enzyme
MRRSALAIGGTAALAALIARAARSNELFLGYLLNTVVNKIPFPPTRLALYRAAGMQIGRDSNIMMHVRVMSPQGIAIGDNCIIGEFTWLDGRAVRLQEGPGLTIGNNVNIGANNIFIAGGHVPDSADFAGPLGRTVVNDRAWVAMSCTILAGVTIGEGAVVSAASLVNKDVAPYTMAGGVPARYLKDRSRDLDYTLVNRARWI